MTLEEALKLVQQTRPFISTIYFNLGGDRRQPEYVKNAGGFRSLLVERFATNAETMTSHYRAAKPTTGDGCG